MSGVLKELEPLGCANEMAFLSCDYFNHDAYSFDVGFGVGVGNSYGVHVAMHEVINESF